MASPFKSIDQIKSFSTFQKLTKLVLDKVGEDAVKAQYCASFEFDKKDAPLLLVGELPTPLLMEIKKLAGTLILGRCSANNANQLVFEGGVKPGMARKALAALGIQRVVAAGSDDEDEAEEGGGKETEGKSAPSKASPLATTPSPAAAQKLPVGDGKEEKKSSAPLPRASAVPKAISPKKEVRRIPKPGVTKETIAAKDEFAKRIKALFPLYQNACKVPGAPEPELKQFFKAAGEAAVKTDFVAAQAVLDQLEAVIGETLGTMKAPSPGESETPEQEGEDQGTPLMVAKVAKSRQAWQKAMVGANASINALQSALLKTKDPRAPGLASGFNRILKKLPNPDAALEALALAAEQRDAKATDQHKADALQLAKRCHAYLGSDRLIKLATGNPFVPLKLAEQFKGALQTLQAELQ